MEMRRVVRPARNDEVSTLLEILVKKVMEALFAEFGGVSTLLEILPEDPLSYLYELVIGEYVSTLLEILQRVGC